MSAAVFAAVVGVVAIAGHAQAESLTGLARRWLDVALTTRTLSIADVQLQLDTAVHAVVAAAAPIACAALVAGAICGGLQTGGYFSGTPLAPKGDRLSPAAGIKRLLCARSAIEVVKTWLKLAIVAAAVASCVPSAAVELAHLATNSAGDAMGVVAHVLRGVAIRVAVAMLALGAADVFVQRRLHARDLRMSKDEVKRDSKEDEGDPLVKHARRQAHREIGIQRMVLAAGSASFVVVNPTHLATAVRYDEARDDAPRVIAKGVGELARRIRRAAEHSGVRIVYNKPLARSLYRVPLDQVIPSDLYAVVAEVLAVIRREEELMPQRRSR